MRKGHIARVRAHIFLCMLAYYLTWHLKGAWGTKLSHQLSCERRPLKTLLIGRFGALRGGSDLGCQAPSGGGGLEWPRGGGLEWPRGGGLEWPHFASVDVCG